MPDLTPKQIEDAQGLLRHICPNLALAFSEQVSQEVTIDLLDVRQVSLSELLARSDSALQTQFTLNHPEGSESVFVIPEDAALILANLIERAADEEAAGVLSDAQIDTLSTAMSGVVRGFTLALTDVTGDPRDIESSSTHVGVLTVPPVFALEGSAIEVRYSVSIPELLDTTLSALFTGVMVADLLPTPESRQTPDMGTTANTMLSEDDVAAMLSQVGGGERFDSSPRQTVSSGLTGGLSSDLALPRGLDMILDIPLDVTVELGRVRMLIKDVLELSSGSIIELDRVAGDPVDLLVNGRLVAKGEVVVIEDNFGIRITEITSPAERVVGLGRGR